MQVWYFGSECDQFVEQCYCLLQVVFVEGGVGVCFQCFVVVEGFVVKQVVVVDIVVVGVYVYV